MCASYSYRLIGAAAGTFVVRATVLMTVGEEDLLHL